LRNENIDPQLSDQVRANSLRTVHVIPRDLHPKKLSRRRPGGSRMQRE
jgi:hypothetical protein